MVKPRLTRQEKKKEVIRAKENKYRKSQVEVDKIRDEILLMKNTIQNLKLQNKRELEQKINLIRTKENERLRLENERLRKLKVERLRLENERLRLENERLRLQAINQSKKKAKSKEKNKKRSLKRATKKKDETIKASIFKGDINAFNTYNKDRKVIYTKEEATKIIQAFKGTNSVLIIRLKRLNPVNDKWETFRHEYIFNEITAPYIFQILTNQFIIKENELDSGKYQSITENEIIDLQIRILKPSNNVMKTDKTGGLFKYLNTSYIDLSRYQIYTKQQIEDGLTSNNENCLIYTLDQLQLPISDIYGLHLELKTTFTAKSDLTKIADKLNIRIKLYEYTDKSRTSYHGSMNKEIKEYSICLFKEHYFVYEDMEISTSFINKYNILKEQLDLSDIEVLNKAKRFNKFDNGRIKYFKDLKGHKITSIELIRSFFECGLFIQNDIIDNEVLKYQKPNSINLDKIEQEIMYKQQTEEKDNTKTKQRLIFIADTECQVKASEFSDTIHEPILICIKELNKGSPKVFKGINCIDQMLDYIIYKTSYDFIPRVYFHNLKYDIHVILHKFNEIINILESDGMTYTYTIKHNKRMIEFYDSYKLIRAPIRDMPKTFNLDKQYHKNEAIAYEYHTMDNIMSNEEIDTNIYRELLQDKIKPIFDELMNDNKTFNPSKYYIDYCIFDVLILEQSLLVFDNSIKQIFNKSIFDFITISSLGFSLIKDLIVDIPMASMNLRSFIDEAIYGGRVICAKKNNHIKRDIQDFDAVSMYPSAIVRLCEDMGVPTTIPRKIGDFNLVKNNNNEYYIVRIRITKINKTLQIPIVCFKTDKDNQYLNHIDEPIEVVVDKTTLEDYVKYQEIEYEFIEGVSYSLINSNRALKDLITSLFNERLKAKKDNNKVLSEVYKLILNSIYGKTIQKAHYDKNIIKTKDKLDDHLIKYSELVSNIYELNNNNYLIKQYTYDSSYSYNIIGMMILSMSKRMMNEVFYCAKLEDVNIYYTDTDSIHIDADGVDKVAKRYKKEYNKELIGKNLKQFHCDFELEGCKNVISKECIIVDKKIYIDRLEGTNEKGDKIIDYHYRMKGISKKALINHIDKNYKGDFIEFYKQLIKSDRKKEEIVMNFDKYNVNFDITHRNVSTKKIGTFIRTI